jgi:hypothetical protein
MDLDFETKNDRVTNVLKGDDRVGVITERNGQIGYRIFGEPKGGEVESRQDARQAFREHFA